MKKQVNSIHKLFILMTLIYSSCRQEEIALYDNDRYIQFSTPFTDSVTASFIISSDSNRMLVPLEMELIGFPSNEDMHYRLRVIPERSTAKEKHINLEEKYVFRKSRVIDTAWIKVNNSPELSISPVRVVFEIIGTETLKVGDLIHSQKIMYVSNMIFRPSWWNNTVQSQYLGTYSDKKFKLFAQVNGILELDPNDLTLLRQYTVQFKNYLLREKDEGRTIYEENGTEMTITLTGG